MQISDPHHKGILSKQTPVYSLMVHVIDAFHGKALSNQKEIEAIGGRVWYDPVYPDMEENWRIQALTQPHSLAQDFDLENGFYIEFDGDTAKQLN